MPQEIWRSFVTCDDPLGVVQCKTIRENKNSSSRNKIMSVHNKTEPLNSSSSDYNLMRVSKETKKLNRLIDSLSDGQHYLANDLLKGAIDLQQSILLLGKFQEASQYMSHLKILSQYTKSDPKIPHQSRRSLSDHFSDRVVRMEFRNSRLFTDMDSSSASEIPYTSSNQTSAVNNDRFRSVDSFPSSLVLKNKAKPSNLIAKLMGLEQLPTSELPNKQMKSENIVNQSCRPTFDVEKAIIGKHQSLRLKEDPKKRTLGVILENVQLKRLIKSNSAKELKYHSSGSPEDALIDNARPIVLIKPLSVPFLESNEPVAPKFQDFGTDMIVRKLKTKDEPVIEAGEKALNRKIKASDCKVLVKKSEEKQIDKRKQKSLSNKVKASGPGIQQKRVASEKKTDLTPKVLYSSRKAAEKETLKSKNKNFSISQDQAKPRKQEKTLNTKKNRTSSSTPTVTRKSNVRKSLVKKEKGVCESVACKLQDENSGRIKDEKMSEDELVDKKMIDICFEGCSEKLEHETLLKVAEDDTVEESCNEKTVDEINPQSEEIPNHQTHPANHKSFKTNRITQDLLLTSPPFLSLAEKLFDLTPNTPKQWQMTCNNNCDFENEKLHFDVVKELVERKSFPDSNVFHSVSSLSMSCNSRMANSLDQLLDEVRTGLETLKNYSKSDGHENINIYADALYSILERDMSGTAALVSGTWDNGWRTNGFSMNTAEQVVVDIEKLILSGNVAEKFLEDFGYPLRVNSKRQNTDEYDFEDLFKDILRACSCEENDQTCAFRDFEATCKLCFTFSNYIS
ncbi:hypothetical protein ACFE04_018899 [Oxalis oulophora]